MQETKKSNVDEELNLFTQFKRKFEKTKSRLSLTELIIQIYQPKDASSLAVIRFLYGLLMVCDLIEERGGSVLDLKWGETRNCHFPLFDALTPLELEHMCLLYLIMWIGAWGIMLGYKFTYSCLMFAVPYWYVLLLDKTQWNNHSYLYGILALLFLSSSANYCYSLDSLSGVVQKKTVPHWNYLVLRFQVFLLYFYAGLKKTDMEWLHGYAMTDLGKHWIFDPFKIILTSEQIDFLVVHWLGFLLDLTIGFWLLHKKTRPYALFFCSCFHLMNSRLFSIGMFPYVGLATLPIFCEFDWPRSLTNQLVHVHDLLKGKVWELFNKSVPIGRTETGKSGSKLEEDELPPKVVGKKHRCVLLLLFLHFFLQLFLPYSHFVTKGYNNWTNGLYGYSWDMMVHSWNTVLVVVKVVDNKSQREYYLDPNAWVDNLRWTKHGDMTLQYAQCLKKNLLLDFEESKSDKTNTKSYIKELITSEDISVFIDVWCSLNGRFQQRMFDPNYDLLQANWSPFKPVEWLLPLLTEYSDLRVKMDAIQKEVYQWSNATDVLFVADFPGMYLENYITDDMTNVTLTVIEGVVSYKVENQKMKKGLRLGKGDSVKVPTEVFHKVTTLSNVPSCFMYTYTNQTAANILNESSGDVEQEFSDMRSPFPILEDSHERYNSLKQFLYNVGNAFVSVLHGAPMVRRKKSQNA